MDGTLHAGLYECICPPGMVGNGIDTCDIFYYQTVFEARSTQINNFDAEAFVDNLYALGVVPPWVRRASIQVTISVGAATVP